MVATVLALSFVVLSVPKLYGFGVIVITSAALLSQSICLAYPVAPAVCLVDMLISTVVVVCRIPVVAGRSVVA
ncbi:hypothetical protein JK2ML_0575 [Mycobacterium leprae Kyoto-2]|uniref:Uncharacterized protein n=3 Tax=Mycobacterium leprae TaxID=1769 RepID=Q9CCN6_MYCLE|nr:hypothetical protein [Mycobacterium leprae]CAR70668.1 hypothetical protein MLBr00575 [Mycobacterium leprae Br4923]AWV48963.1 hypothetical protein DIJ64_03130 [Mycobacterium leprae]OAR20916.1 hypothetical protein A8144_08660 [Mycobacterium leprae 3125609]OAX71050.1 hypothetical protein A3216_08305 [Mycobacterium leprae 7935681]CAC30083.1 hypothetical protein [Mycobacterium leprae]